MLDNIKSCFFVKLIFSYLDEKRILELVSYNKNLQNIIDINLINYKMLGDKYKIVETNGRIKEFFRCNDKIAYEGEYLNGKRNGKGKEYNKKGQLIYEGEYSNGKRHGKGKEYWNTYDFILIFEGKFSNGHKWDGKEYFKYIDGKEEIISEMKNGQGFIKKYYEYRNDVSQIEGEYKNGKMNGKGKERYYSCCLFDGSRIIFEGEYKNGKKWNGKGGDASIYNLINGKGYMEEIGYDYYFEGEYVNGEKNGKGKEYEKGGLIFEGEYKNGKKNGKGKEYYNDEILLFEGEYKNGFRAKGKEYYFHTHHENKNRFRGRGKEYYFHTHHENKLYFEGDYKSGIKWNGKGYDENGKIIFEITNGKGFIIEYYNNYNNQESLDLMEYYNRSSLGNVIKFEGEYLNGEKNGKGKEFNDHGKLLFEGEYKNGERSNGKEYYYQDINPSKFSYDMERIDKEIESIKIGELVYEGEYKNGERWNGKGKEYDYFGKLIYEGEYLNGEKCL